MHPQIQQHIQYYTQLSREMTFRKHFLDELILKENNAFIDLTQLNFQWEIHRILNVTKLFNNKLETAYSESVFQHDSFIHKSMDLVAGLW